MVNVSLTREELNAIKQLVVRTIASRELQNATYLSSHQAMKLRNKLGRY